MSCDLTRGERAAQSHGEYRRGRRLARSPRALPSTSLVDRQAHRYGGQGDDTDDQDRPWHDRARGVHRFASGLGDRRQG